MAHWAELDENNVVIRVLVGDNDDPNGDEGYQWLIDNLGGRWLKTSYNTLNGKHLQDDIPLRGNFAGIGMIYDENLDVFIMPKPYKSWSLDLETYQWMPPFEKPDSGFWIWSEQIDNWEEIE